MERRRMFINFTEESLVIPLPIFEELAHELKGDPLILFLTYLVWLKKYISQKELAKSKMDSTIPIPEWEYPSNKKVAKKLHWTENRVTKSAKKLQELGYIKKKTTSNGKDFFHTFLLNLKKREVSPYPRSPRIGESARRRNRKKSNHSTTKNPNPTKKREVSPYPRSPHHGNQRDSICLKEKEENKKEIEKKKDKEEKEKSSNHLLDYFLSKLESNLMSKSLSSKLEEWIAYRKEIKRPLTKRAIDIQAKMLNQFDAKTILAIIDQSLERTWTGLFPLKSNSFQQNQKGGDYDARQKDLSKYSKKKAIQF